MPNKHLIAAGLLSLFSAAGQAQNLSLELTNLTQAIHFTPIIAGAHDDNGSIFSVATAASNELETLAEEGGISGVSSLLSGAGADVIENPNEGLLAPASSVSFTMTNSDGNDYLSIAAMMLPTNDAFIGLDSWEIPSEAGTYTVYLNAYDAGTEVNDELISSIPADPSGQAGTGGSGVTTEESNTNVHIHPGVLGDTDSEAGISDLDSTAHRWLNPVAKLTITVE